MTDFNAQKTFEVYKNYLDTLEQEGYMPYDAVQKLLVLGFMQDICTGYFDELVSEEDYQVLNNCYDHVAGIKLIPYNVYTKVTQLPKHHSQFGNRLTED